MDCFKQDCCTDDIRHGAAYLTIELTIWLLGFLVSGVAVILRGELCSKLITSLKALRANVQLAMLSDLRYRELFF